jgi:formate dehydrogenase subunit delta
MDVSNIVRMANQITAFFAVYPKQEALDGIAKHIHATWEPRLRNTLKAHFDTGGAGLNPLCIEAMTGYFRGPNSPNARRVTRPDRMRRRARSQVLRTEAATAAEGMTCQRHSTSFILSKAFNDFVTVRRRRVS